MLFPIPIIACIEVGSGTVKLKLMLSVVELQCSTGSVEFMLLELNLVLLHLNEFFCIEICHLCTLLHWFAVNVVIDRYTSQ